MAFKNRVRLPMQLHSAQFPEERTVFRKANGTTKTLSVVIRKQYELETDWLPERWHERLKIALAHDNVTLEGERYLGGISQDGDYNIEWPEGVLHHPTAKAGVKVQVTPFEATNDNCQTCEEASQLDLEDDDQGEMEEGTEYVINVPDNDSICCYPAVFSLVSFNSDYLTAATINPATGVLTVTTGTGLTAANNVIIATYRVTCPNGSYDDADVIADINGTIPGCLGPINIQNSTPGVTDHFFSWDDGGSGALDYEYQVFEGTGPIGTPEWTGNAPTNNVTLEGFDPGQEYYFQVRSVCDEDNFSSWVGVGFTQPPMGEVCGSYSIYNSNLAGFANVSYIDCNGNNASVIVFALSSRIVCALQSSPGNPVSITLPFAVTNTYLGEC